MLLREHYSVYGKKMNISSAGINFIKSHEKLILSASLDDMNIRVIGYGHRENICENQVITQEEADEWLKQDLLKCSELLNNVIEVPVSQNQFDALCSFLFSVGAGQRGVKSGLVELRSGQPSALLLFLNQGCYAAAAEQFGSWIYAGNTVKKDLILRREHEKNLFLRKRRLATDVILQHAASGGLPR